MEVGRLNKILKTFDYENTLIKEYENWSLLLRSDQVTLGSLVLIEKSFKTKYSEISDSSFKEFGDIVKKIEPLLNKLFSYEKINYMMLMMRDDEVHYHIIPRYSKIKNFNSIEFIDSGWPALPDMTFVNPLDSETASILIDAIKKLLK
jgi:diadenosine tetraphosphate (Ap4A) HIT family hydrolase